MSFGLFLLFVRSVCQNKTLSWPANSASDTGWELSSVNLHGCAFTTTLFWWMCLQLSHSLPFSFLHTCFNYLRCCAELDIHWIGRREVFLALWPPTNPPSSSLLTSIEKDVEIHSQKLAKWLHWNCCFVYICLPWISTTVQQNLSHSSNRTSVYQEELCLCLLYWRPELNGCMLLMWHN